jgi:predicted dehydrogenase
MENNNRIKVGLIGCGTVAQYGHLPTIAATPQLELVAIADVAEPTVESISAQYQVAGTTNYHELLARPDIVAVTVSTPLLSHYEVAAAAMRAGKHVFVEKPFADSIEHCKELVEIAKETGSMLGVNFEYRFDEGVLKMRELLQSGELGRLQVMRFVNNWSAHGVNGAAGARRARFLQDGGGSMDCGIHFLDLARFLSQSEVASMSAVGQWVEPQFKGPGHMLIQARMDSGALALVEASFVYTHNSLARAAFMQYEVIGERGVATWCTPPTTPGGSFSNQKTELHILTQDRTEVFPFSTEKQFATVYNEWARCLARGSMQGSPLATGQDGSQAACWMWDALAQAEAERAASPSAA